jgi:hypothetical protein
MALEDLRQQLSRARPTQPAPAAWSACLDQALRALAGPEDQGSVRQDRPTCMTVAALHERVIAVLDQFDAAAGDAPPTPVREREHALSHQGGEKNEVSHAW